MAFSETREARLPRHEILHQLRGLQEERHRDLVCNRSVDSRWIFQPSVSDMTSLAAEMTLEDADDCCNKDTGIYVHSAKRTNYICLFLQTLHTYLYERWFRPYKSEIEYVQFIAKTFLPELFPEDLRPGALANLAVSVHAAICNRPSSEWVDTKIHTGWCGGGVYSDNWKRRAQMFERENDIWAEKMYPEPYELPGIIRGSRKHWKLW